MSGAATSDLPIPELNVTTVRVVAHLVSPLVPGGQVSQNHWSIYLVISSGGSVRLNMEWVSGTAGDEGTFTVKRHFYATSKTAIRVFDYDVPPGTKVESFLGIVREKKRHSYNMTPTGAGCRFWVLTVFQDWVQAGLITIHNAVQHLNSVIGFNYSRTLAPIKLEILEGEWV